VPKKTAPQSGVRRALDQEQLVLFYQPIHDLRSRKIVAAEALLRSQRANGEIRSGEPIAAGAEEGPDLFRLDSWMLQTALRDAAAWQRDGADVSLSVNLSPREFENRGVAARLKNLVTTCGGDPTKISLEITETHHIVKIEQTREVIAELKETGVKLWLDDFGTGHSSMTHLLRFPADGLKLPGTFIREIAADQRAAAIVRSLISLARELDMLTIAEGVENEDQLAMLDAAGCELVQGFLFSRPMPCEAFLEELRTG
jgi:EAL domain-containing protein (putative c-di-GMP-specific phosphodiesterase class I)